MVISLVPVMNGATARPVTYERFPIGQAVWTQLPLGCFLFQPLLSLAQFRRRFPVAAAMGFHERGFYLALASLDLFQPFHLESSSKCQERIDVVARIFPRILSLDKGDTATELPAASKREQINIQSLSFMCHYDASRCAA